MPVSVSSNAYAYIVVLQTVRKLVEFDYTALEHVSTMLALDRIKAKEIEEVKHKIRQDFFDDLLAGNITSTETLHSLSAMHGLKVNYAYYCTVIHVEATQLENYTDMVYRKYEMEHMVKKCVNLIYGLSSNAGGELICYYRNQQIIILIGKNENKPPISVSDTKAFAQEVLQLLAQEMTKNHFLIGIGSQYKTLASLHRSFFDTRKLCGSCSGLIKTAGALLTSRIILSIIFWIPTLSLRKWRHSLTKFWEAFMNMTRR